jgi:DNA-binding winged helix-turn-helix (wHTH) protein
LALAELLLIMDGNSRAVQVEHEPSSAASFVSATSLCRSPASCGKIESNCSSSMDPTAVSEQIEKILHSRTFAGKGQLRKLLQLLHQCIDSPAELKTEQVIRELWPSETRTKRSADVATEMNRLRHALDSYYEEEGCGDPITVYLPNRSANSSDGAHEARWIATKPRNGIEFSAPDEVAIAAVAHSRRTLPTARVIAAGIGLAIAIFVLIYSLAVPPQPQSGRMEGTVLRIYDSAGKELWTKNFPEGFGPDWYYDVKLWGPHIWFADLEGKGHSSVLFSYSPAASALKPNSSTLICYSDRGKEQWRWVPGRDLPELNGSPATYKTHALAVLKATEKRPPRIVVSSQHDPWWPNQIAILDAHGKLLSEYWHSGTLTYMTLADLDGDGKQEIVATGVANGYDHEAVLVVLDPDRVFGASTEIRPEFQIHGMGTAQERLRLLFPRSDLNRALYQYNVAMQPTLEHGILRLTAAECITIPAYSCPIWYEFDRDFHLIAAFAGGDEFRSAHNKYFQVGKDSHKLSDEEQLAFQKVRCLVGCKSEFVSVGKMVP